VSDSREEEEEVYRGMLTESRAGVVPEQELVKQAMGPVLSSLYGHNGRGEESEEDADGGS
ncbi:hypothetical protein GBF38_020909, partial [Nibea albiflora]